VMSKEVTVLVEIGTPKSDAVRVWSVWMTWVRTMSVNELKELLKRTYQGR